MRQLSQTHLTNLIYLLLIEGNAKIRLILMGSRLAVGQQILDLPAGVRIPAPQYHQLTGQDKLLPHFFISNYRCDDVGYPAVHPDFFSESKTHANCPTLVSIR